MNVRTQLTLFVPVTLRASLDALRKRLDPVQAQLIGAHVTLCREDEIAGLSPDVLLERVGRWSASVLSLAFGPPERHFGHGVLLPCLSGMTSYQALRQWILQDENARPHAAHLTLAHPRNPRADGNTDEALLDAPRALCVDFPTVALIEQVASQPWRTLREVRLSSLTGEAT